MDTDLLSGYATDLYRDGWRYPVRHVGWTDRPGIALAGAMEGDARRVVWGLLNPDKLSPQDRETISDKMGAGKEGLSGLLVRTVTNPLFLIGGLLALRSPLGSAVSTQRVAAQFSAYARKLAPLGKSLMTAWDAYRGTTFPSLLTEFALTRESLEAQARGGVEKTIKEYLGAGGAPIRNTLRADLIHAKLAGLDQDVARTVRAITGKGSAGLRLVEREALSPALVKPVTLTPHEESIARSMREGYDAMWAKWSGAVRGAADKYAQGGDRSDFLAHIKELVDPGDYRALAGKKGGTHNPSGVRDMLYKLTEPTPFYVPRYKVDQQGAFEIAEGVLAAGGASQKDSVRLLGRMRERIMGGREEELIREGVGEKTREKVREALSDSYFYPSARSRLRGDPLTWDQRALERLGQAGMLRDPEMVYRNRARSEAILRSGADPRTAGPVSMDPFALYEEYSRRTSTALAFSGTDVPGHLVAENQRLHAGARKVLGEKGETDEHLIGLREGMNFRQAFGAELSSVRSDALRKDMVDVWMPMAKGQMTVQQYSQRMFWSGMKQRFGELVDSQPWLGKTLKGTLGEERFRAFREHLEEVPPGRVGDALAKWVYAGTLSSPTAALQNLLQTYSTTVQQIPARHVAAAHGDALKATAEYVRLAGQGVGKQEALERAFPILKRMGAQVIGDTASMAEQMDAAVRQGKRLGQASGVVDDAINMMLGPFQMSERFVRVLNAMAAERYAVESGITEAGALRGFVSRSVQQMQFSGGTANQIRGLVNVPTPLKQFVSYPLRLAGTLAFEAPYAGESQSPQFLSGGLGRMLMWSVPTVEAFRTLLDVDVDQSVGLGGLPWPSSYGAFAPVPRVPPLVGLIGGGLTGLATGDFSEAMYQLPAFVPGGILAKRVVEAYGGLEPGGVASTLRIGHVGWDQAVNGMYPYFNGDGSLIGWYSAEQVAMKAVGVDATGTRRESEALKYLTTQREEMQAMRGRFTEAVMMGDSSGAGKVQQEWTAMFPGMGPINLDGNMVSAWQRKQELTRLETVTRGLPAEVRPFFAGAVAAGFDETRFSGSYGGQSARSPFSGSARAVGADPTRDLSDRLTNADNLGGPWSGFSSTGGWFNQQ